MHDPAGRDALIVWQALSVETKNLEAATEVICSRTPTQIQHFKQIYHSKFGVPLEHDIERSASGDHKKVKFLSIYLNLALVKYIQSSHFFKYIQFFQSCFMYILLWRDVSYLSILGEFLIIFSFTWQYL